MSYLKKMQLPETLRLFRLTPPQGVVHAVLDTDTYNEVDDQFALAYALLCGDRFSLDAVYAAPFENSRSHGPGDGMEKSYAEIHRVLNVMGISREDFVYRGADCWLSDAGGPIDSPATLDLIERAMSSDEPLYVLSIGAPTNIASAILLEPEIVKHLVVVWLGGQPHDWPTAEEFNLRQDLPASRILFDCGVPLIQIPCTNVAEQLRVSIPFLERYLQGKSRIGDYLTELVKGYTEDDFCWSKVIWDISVVAWMVNSDWVSTNLVHSPHVSKEFHYSLDGSRPLMRVATHLTRDAIFRDLFGRLNALGYPEAVQS